jgi:hypothetical protein
MLNCHFGVIDNDRDTHDIWQFAASNGERLHFGATATEHIYDAVERSMLVIDEHNQCMQTLRTFWSIGLARSFRRNS